MQCDCGHESCSYIVLYSPRRRTVCRACTRPRLRDSVANPYQNLELEHVHDDAGQPLRVSSLRQLDQAQRQHHFQHWATSADSVNIDKPPSHRQPTLYEQMSKEQKWLFPEVAEGMVREMQEAGELPR